MFKFLLTAILFSMAGNLNAESYNLDNWQAGAKQEEPKTESIDMKAWTAGAASTPTTQPTKQPPRNAPATRRPMPPHSRRGR